MTNPFRMPRRQNSRIRTFVKGEYNLPRQVRRWLKSRLQMIPNAKVMQAAFALATMIGRYHTGPRVNGRDFFLCRESIPGKLADAEGKGPSEWHLRLARAELIRLGFIERVTPVGERRTLENGRVGRWLKASKTGSAIRAPKVMFRLSVALKRLFSEAPQHPRPQGAAISPVWCENLNTNLESLTGDRRALHTGGAGFDARDLAARWMALADDDARSTNALDKDHTPTRLTFSVPSSLDIMKRTKFF